MIYLPNQAYILDYLTDRHGPKSAAMLMKVIIVSIELLLLIFYYIIGAAYYGAAEGWGVTDSIYFITVSITTGTQTIIFHLST